MSAPAAKRAKVQAAQSTDDLRITGINPLLPPACLSEELPLDAALGARINGWRDSIGQVIRGEDDRLVVIVGPCSIHDPKAVLEYAARLKGFAEVRHSS